MALKDRFKRVIISNRLLARGMDQLLKMRYTSAFEVEVERRNGLSLFDFEALSADMPYGPREGVIDNNLYGHVQALRTYSGATGRLDAYLEHGYFWGGIVHHDAHAWWVPRVLTLSSHRVSILRQKLPKKEAVALGPYIHYAQPVLSSMEMKALKASLGRVLLVFPSHAVKGTKAEFNLKEFIERVKILGLGYQSILISLYYLERDFPERVAAYREAGFKVVTSGHRFDPNFIRRQRALIELADLTASNDMGTHVGYCLYLNKPHVMIHQEVKLQEVAAGALTRLQNQGAGDTFSMAKAEMEEGAQLFTDSWEAMDQAKARQWVATRWGFDDVKSPDEIKRLFGGVKGPF